MRDDHLKLRSGRTVLHNRGIFGLVVVREFEDRLDAGYLRECGGLQLTEGYDSHADMDTHAKESGCCDDQDHTTRCKRFTADERREIAEMQIKMWKRYGGIA